MPRIGTLEDLANVMHTARKMDTFKGKECTAVEPEWNSAGSGIRPEGNAGFEYAQGRYVRDLLEHFAVYRFLQPPKIQYLEAFELCEGRPVAGGGIFTGRPGSMHKLVRRESIGNMSRRNAPSAPTIKPVRRNSRRGLLANDSCSFRRDGESRMYGEGWSALREYTESMHNWGSSYWPASWRSRAARVMLWMSHLGVNRLSPRTCRAYCWKRCHCVGVTSSVIAYGRREIE